MTSAIRVYTGPFGRALLLNVSSRLATHAHHHCHILVKVSGPDVSFIVRDKVCTLTSKNILLLNAWETHTYLHQPDASCEDTGILALHIEPGWLSEAEPRLRHVAHPRFFPDPLIDVSPKVREFADNVIMELCWTDHFDGNRLEGILFEFITQVISSSLSNQISIRRAQDLYMPSIDKRIRKAIALIQENKMVELGVDELARECNLSRAHFFTLFRDQTNVTPNVYANTFKMEEAFARLSQPEGSVAGLSLDLGFSAPGHLTRFFSLHQGITPSEYRKKVQNLI